MPDYDDTDDSFNTKLRDSFNTSNTTTTSNLAVDLDNVGNTDNSVEGSGNTAADLTDVGNVDNSVNGSGNSYTEEDNVGNVDSHDTDLGVDGSFNDNSDNSWTDDSDNSTNGSWNDSSTHAVVGSYNAYMDESMDDHSMNVGNRDYSTGFGDLSLGGGVGGGGGGGDIWVNNQNTIVDQSVNGNFDGWGEGAAGGGSTAVIASGDGAYAAGGDINLSQSVDRSTNMDAGGDINLDNTTDVTNVIGSYNEETVTSSWTDSSTDVGIDDSFNDESQSYMADNSFNDELTSHTESTWDIDADVIWGSGDAAIVEDTTVDVDFDS